MFSGSWELVCFWGVRLDQLQGPRISILGKKQEERDVVHVVLVILLYFTLDWTDRYLLFLLKQSNFYKSMHKVCLNNCSNSNYVRDFGNFDSRIQMKSL